MNSRHSNTLLAGLALLLFVFAWYSLGEREKAKSGAQTEKSEVTNDAVAEPGVIARTEAGAVATPIASPAASPALIENIRQEVAENPHHTPPSLIAFAQHLAARMEHAEGSSDSRAARVLFEELAQCMSTGHGAGRVPQLQVSCLTNAERLAIKYPELRDAAKKLREQAPQDVKTLMRALDQAAG